MIETEGGPVNSDRFLRQNEASNIETNFNTNTNTADVKKITKVQHGLSPSGNLINMHKIGKIASVGFNSQLLANT